MAKIDVESPNKNLAYCIGGDGSGRSPWLIGVETVSDELDGLDMLDIPATTYLVFKAHGPMNPNFFEMQSFAYDIYFNDPEREYNWYEGMRSFEKYFTEDVNSADTLIELWCPVVKK